MTHVDVHRPCPVCAKPFEVESIRRVNPTPMDKHLRESHGLTSGYRSAMLIPGEDPGDVAKQQGGQA